MYRTGVIYCYRPSEHHKYIFMYEGKAYTDSARIVYIEEYNGNVWALARGLIGFNAPVEELHQVVG